MNTPKSIFIVEDEPIIAADIASILSTNGYRVAGNADSADAALEQLQAGLPDLLLLDIKIEGSRNGIQLATEIRKHYTVPHIFLTSFYDEKTLAQARETEPQAYIVKPFEERDLLISVGLALHKKTITPAGSVPPDKFFIRNNNNIRSVDVNDIFYVQADDNYATLFTHKEKHIVSHTLKSVEEKLLSHGFVRVHRSYIINFSEITAISDGYIYLDIHKVPLGNAYREALINRLTFL